MAAGQAVDHLPRPPLRKKKRRRDGLMEVAAANPKTWAVGFLDECWWSRVALPTLSSFSEEGKPLRPIQQSVAKDDPQPKRSEEHTSELQSRQYLVCRLLLEKKKQSISN